MGNYLTKGTVFADGGPCNAALLNAHVDEAILKPTAISSQILKDPAALSDELLINDGGTLKKVTLQQLHNLILYPGCVVQTVYAEYTANASVTSVIPSDDTVPQSGEGTQILSAPITPRFATSQIYAQFSGQWETSPEGIGSCALFRDSIAGAIASQIDRADIATSFSRGVFNLVFMDSPATASPVTYKIRIGPSLPGAMRMNGTSSVRLHGGAQRAVLVIQEIKA